MRKMGDSMLWFDTVCKSEQNGTAPENATYPPCISPSAPRVGATWLILTLYPSIIPVNSNVLKTFNHFEFLAHLSTQMRTSCSSSKRPPRVSGKYEISQRSLTSCFVVDDQRGGTTICIARYKNKLQNLCSIRDSLLPKIQLAELLRNAKKRPNSSKNTSS